MTEETSQGSTLSLTADIVGAYVSKNSLPASALTDLISKVHQSLSTLSSGDTVEMPAPRAPAVAIKKSVTPDYIISLEDGRKFKSMKRHLGLLSMTPAEYRTKWGLPSDYPMVAPNYAAHRSELAKKMGLGRKPVAPAPYQSKAKGRDRGSVTDREPLILFGHSGEHCDLTHFPIWTLCRTSADGGGAPEETRPQASVHSWSSGRRCATVPTVGKA